MNQLMVIPNFSEGKLICEIDFANFKKQVDELLNDEIYLDRNAKLPKPHINEDILLFLKYAKIDISRFVSNEKITNYISFFSEKINKKGIKVRTYEKRKIVFNIKVLRESVLQYLEFKIKDVESGDVSFYVNDKLVHRNINQTTYKRTIEDLKQTFAYYTQKVNNSTRDENINYTAKRLLSMEISLKSHEQMRKEKQLINEVY